MAERLGPTFQEELRAAGVEGKVLAIRFDGAEVHYTFSPDATAADRRKVDEVVKAHDPNRKLPEIVYKEEQQMSRLATKLMALNSSEIDLFVDSIANDTNGMRVLLKEMLRTLAPIVTSFYKPTPARPVDGNEIETVRF